MNNAEKILKCLDEELNSSVELVLYGRAALLLGFDNPKSEFALSKDVDAVFALGKPEQLLAETNFWDATEKVNVKLEKEGLYITHFFSEDQVILLPDWHDNLFAIQGNWKNLKLFRLSDMDLLLSKFMRYDPIDIEDAIFIVKAGSITKKQIIEACKHAKIPDIPEIHEQFQLASAKIISMI